MKFSCSQQDLNKALNIVSKAVSVRTTIPTLKGILIEAKEDQIILTASDMDITIENKMEARVEESGSIVVPAKLFGDIIRKLPSGDVYIDVENEKLTVKCLNSEFVIVGMPADEFPNIRNTEETADEVVFDKTIFNSMIKKTSFAASIDNTKGVITGILIELNKEELKFVTIDGYRMAIAKENVSGVKEQKVIISAKIMNEISKILTETEGRIDGDLTLLTDNKSAVIKLGNIRIVSRLIAGEFIKYADIVPKQSSIEVKVSKSKLAECVERASLLSKEGKNNLIKLAIRENVMTITSRSEEGNVKEDLLIEKTGDDLDIGFNAKYILDILRVLDDEEILMKFNTGTSPCLVLPTEGEAYEYLLLPVRITNM